MTKSVPHLAETFVVLGPGFRAALEPVDAGLYQRLDAKYAEFANHQMVAMHAFHEDWPTWEMHPAGDEVVVLVSGAATFVLRLDEGETILELARPGEFAVVPKGVWHTARIREATTMLFVTPGEGTLNQSTSDFPSC